jgi:phosphoribosyl-AMP cyclohydrolase / phosphoribosyl-ATP pyrophosphohydrolase
VELRFDPNTCLIPAIAQDRLSGEIRMVAWMNREALAKTLETGNATFFSRSREALWTKGETSGNVLRVHRVIADCDADVVLLLVDPDGPSCHTGRQNCFFQEVRSEQELVVLAVPARPFAGELEAVIEARSQATAEKSYTRSLLDRGVGHIGDKIREEAAELSVALSDETDDRALSEAADLVFHVLVGLRARNLDFRGVLEKLATRTAQSGHAEKASRKPGG